jgi:hypothetical protein
VNFNLKYLGAYSYTTEASSVFGASASDTNY